MSTRTLKLLREAQATLGQVRRQIENADRDFPSRRWSDVRDSFARLDQTLHGLLVEGEGHHDDPLRRIAAGTPDASRLIQKFSR